MLELQLKLNDLYTLLSIKFSDSDVAKQGWKNRGFLENVLRFFRFFLGL